MQTAILTPDYPVDFKSELLEYWNLPSCLLTQNFEFFQKLAEERRKKKVAEMQATINAMKLL